MAVMAVILGLIGIGAIGLGVVVFANGTRVNPQGRTEPERIKHGLSQVPWRGLVASVPSSVKVVTNEDAGHAERLRAAGAFVALAGAVLLVLAVVAAIAAVL